MAKDTLAVYDPCRSYVERFLNYVRKRNDLSFDAAGFTDLNILREYLKNNRIKAVLFSGQSMSGEGDNGSNADFIFREDIESLVIYLGEQPLSENRTGEKNVFFVYRYQSADGILSEIKGILNDHTEESLHIPKGFLRLGGIYSPGEKVSHPETAALIAGELRREYGDDENIKVLYINLEQFSGMDSMMERFSGQNLSDVIYSYKTSPGKLREAIENARGRYRGMDVLSAPENMEDLHVLSGGGWPDFLAKTADAGGFLIILVDSVLFDYELMSVICKHGNIFIPALPEDDEESARVVLTRRSPDRSPDPAAARAKVNEFRQFLTDRNMTDILDKLLEVDM
ncbi:MAG: hypothetical protein HUJ76_03370 [Parasporobacterium sp.]|nr:hypothetical protein [Parasporobacterium sp.]